MKNMLPSTDTHEFLIVNNAPEEIPPDFAVTVAGNDMEPLLSEGDILLVKKQDSIAHGELGVFMIDGVRRVKKMNFKNGYVRLSSIDINCDDITLNMVHDLTCEGKVIKVLHPGECKFVKI
ncbi:S24 family peptidase [Caproiciproducens sp.]|uniref:S24 family peptidase n=1 Tax=Caproiciproducens sp. TaxID=1954376 RepID=UPI00289C4C3E|nr:S24 family peptidase [Caproiciproducens sp.]